MPRPQKGVAFVFDVCLVDSDNRPAFQANPTLATGDVKISKDNGAFANLTTLPTVAPASGRVVKVELSATEMNADRVVVQFVDQTSPSEWDELEVTINTEADIDVDGTVNDAGAAAGDFDGDAGLSASDDFYNGSVLVFTSGTLKGIARKISDYNGTSKNLAFSGSAGTADAPFPTAPANGDSFKILGRIG